MKKTLNVFPLILLVALQGCFSEVQDDFKKLEGRKIEVSDDELEQIVLDLQVKLLNGELPLNSLDNVMRVLGLSTKITVPLAEFELSDARRASLEAKLNTYISLAPTATREDGFVEGCDSLLFTGLMSTADYDVNIADAESNKEKGKWYRNPDQKKCYTDGTSPSTISRDMMIGLAYSLWQSESLTNINETLAYAKKNSWFIGEATNDAERKSRAFMTPALASTFYEIQYKLGGDKNDAARGMFQFYDPKLDGFKAHLDMLSILLRGHLRGGISKSDYGPVLVHSKRQPKNLFYAAVAAAFDDGDMNEVAEGLLDTEKFPAASLPTSADNYCTEYLWQRDYAKKDWDPCPDAELETYSGADFIFLANLVLGNLKRTSKIDPDFK